MKGKININGMLEILRKDHFKKSICSFDAEAFCDDWCALFGEPELVINEEKHTKLWQLNLCHRNLIFDEFTDERK